MHSTFALAAGLAAVAYASPVPQEFSSTLAPSAPAPAGCAASFTGKFQIAAVNVTSASKRDLETRQTSCEAPGSLTLTLASGTLTDAVNRIGYIASNYQFQFDAPPQAGTIYNAGFSACGNSTLALGGSSIFYQCLSGDFYNLYDRHWAPQCNAIYLQILPCGGVTAPGNGIGQVPDGQVTGTKVGAPVTQIADGQVQASTGVAAPVTQIGDGQVQAPTGKPAPVTQIGDGQIQAPTGKPTVAPITQISDGQIQAPTGTPTPKPAPVTQIGDGQIQAPTGTPTPKPSVAPISQIPDGQIQAPTGSAKPTTALAPVTQIGDGQVQAPTGTTVPKPANTTTPPAQFTGAASRTGSASGFAVVVLVVAGVIML